MLNYAPCKYTTLCLKISENELLVTLMSYTVTTKYWTRFERGIISFQGAVKNVNITLG